MALLKTITLKGYDVSYWHISEFRYSKIENTTYALLRGYKDKAAREVSVENFFPDSQMNYGFEGRLNESDIYGLVKQPVIESVLVTPYQPEVGDGVGNVITPEQQAVYEQVDRNPLSGASDCL
jgi:hypothetical protein